MAKSREDERFEVDLFGDVLVEMVLKKSENEV
jgi:hypothetical protein